MLYVASEVNHANVQRKLRLKQKRYVASVANRASVRQKQSAESVDSLANVMPKPKPSAESVDNLVANLPAQQKPWPKLSQNPSVESVDNLANVMHSQRQQLTLPPKLKLYVAREANRAERTNVTLLTQRPSPKEMLRPSLKPSRPLRPSFRPPSINLFDLLFLIAICSSP
jgi:hypothetical protein